MKAQCQAARGGAGPLPDRGLKGRGGRMRHHAAGKPQHPGVGKQGEWWPWQVHHAAPSLTGDVAKGTKATLPWAALSSRSPAGAWAGSAAPGQRQGTLSSRKKSSTALGGTWWAPEVHLPLAMQLLKHWFLNGLCTLCKLTVKAYGKHCLTSLCLPQGK